MKRRAFIGLVGGAAAWPLAVRAQTPGRIYRVGFLTGRPRQEPGFVALLDEFRQVGLTEGQNLTVLGDDISVADNGAAAAATALVESFPDAIVVFGLARAKAVQMATKTIPIVTMTEDMVADGLASSLAHPGGNITGISLISLDLDGKRGDLLLEAVPRLSHIAVLADPTVDTPSHLQVLKDSAKTRGVELSVFSAKTKEEIVSALDAAKSSGARAINVLATQLFFLNGRLVIERANELRLPAVYQWPEMAEQGGLFGYGPRITGQFRVLGRQLIKVLQGTRPGDVPIEQPSKFELVINLRTANQIGLDIPASFVLRADKVIE
jgi:putative tryptophan/tyrosine transport system substrate-binding protein